MKKLQTHLDIEIGWYGWIEEGALIPNPDRKDKIDVDDINDAFSGTPALVERANRGIKAGYRYVGKSDTHYALISVSYFKNILYQGENSR